MKDPRGHGLQFKTDMLSQDKHLKDKTNLLIKMMKQEQDKKKAKQNEKIQEV